MKISLFYIMSTTLLVAITSSHTPVVKEDMGKAIWSISKDELEQRLWKSIHEGMDSSGARSLPHEDMGETIWSITKDQVERILKEDVNWDM